MKRALTILLLALAAVSCSTTRRLGEGELRLADNKVVVVGEGPSTSELQPYIKQKPNAYFIGKWNPLLYVYNWSSGKDTPWDKFVEKLGVAPVAFNSSLVERAILLYADLYLSIAPLFRSGSWRSPSKEPV